MERRLRFFFAMLSTTACYTISIVSCIHVNTTKLRNIKCTLVATCVILWSLECTTLHGQLSNIANKGMHVGDHVCLISPLCHCHGVWAYSTLAMSLIPASVCGESTLGVGCCHGCHLRATSHMSQEPWPWNCRAQKRVSKGRPNIPPKSCSVVTDPQV
jgi:hypothetical protein